MSTHHAKKSQSESETPRPITHDQHVHEGDLPQAVSMDALDADRPKHKKGPQPFRFEGDKAFAISSDGAEVEVDPGNARDAAHACMEADDESVRKVAADVARLYPV